MSVYIVHEQLRRLQTFVHMLAHSKDFIVSVVCLQFHARAFLKFKLSCTIVSAINIRSDHEVMEE